MRSTDGIQVTTCGTDDGKERKRNRQVFAFLLPLVGGAAQDHARFSDGVQVAATAYDAVEVGGNGLGSVECGLLNPAGCGATEDDATVADDEDLAAEIAGDAAQGLTGRRVYVGQPADPLGVRHGAKVSGQARQIDQPRRTKVRHPDVGVRQTGSPKQRKQHREPVPATERPT